MYSAVDFGEGTYDKRSDSVGEDEDREEHLLEDVVVDVEFLCDGCG